MSISITHYNKIVCFRYQINSYLHTTMDSVINDRLIELSEEMCQFNNHITKIGETNKLIKCWNRSFGVLLSFICMQFYFVSNMFHRIGYFGFTFTSIRWTQWKLSAKLSTTWTWELRYWRRYESQKQTQDCGFGSNSLSN